MFIPKKNIIVGRNPVVEALKNAQTIDKILLSKNASGDVINEIYLKIKINKNDSWKNTNFNTYETIFGVIDNIEFLYNDKVLSKFDSDFMFSYFEMFEE